MDSDTLAGIIRGYDQSFSPDTVKRALREDESGELAAWAATHLTSDTLLTAEELLQYSALERSGKAHQLGTLLDSRTVLCFEDSEIRAAIQELNRSTDAIQRQSDTLRHQQDVLDRLFRNESANLEARTALEHGHSQSFELDRKASLSTVAGLSQETELQLSELESGGSVGLAAIQQLVDSMCVGDDKLLQSLQKLGWELETEDVQDKEDVDNLRDICARLIKYTVEACRTKLDRIYLESLEAASRVTGGPTVQADDIAAAQDELESLYSEVLPVAQMSVKQQFLDPALKSLSTRNGNALLKAGRAIDYIHDCLDYLLEKTDTACSHIEAFHAHQVASSQVIAIAKSELAAAVEQPPKKERRPTVGASPTRRRKSSGHGDGMSPMRVRGGPPSKPRRRSSGSGVIGDEPPLDQLLRMLALSLPSTDDMSQPPSSNQQVTALATALTDRSTKLADVAANVQESFETAATTQIRDSSSAFQVLRDSLLAESPFGEVKLVDPEIEASIRVLDQELEKVRTNLEKRDTEITLIRGRRGKQDELIRRWAS